MTSSVQERVRRALRAVPDYPKPGVLFQDITPVLRDGALFRSATDAMAKLASVIRIIRNPYREVLFMSGLLYLVARGRISIERAPLGGVNLNTASVNVGFRFQSSRLTDCGRASSPRLVITILRGSGLLPAVIQICQSIWPWRKA